MTLDEDLETMRELRAEVLAYATKREEAQQRLSEHCRAMTERHTFPKGGVLHAGRYWLIRSRGRTFFPVESEHPIGGRK